MGLGGGMSRACALCLSLCLSVCGAPTQGSVRAAGAPRESRPALDTPSVRLTLQSRRRALAARSTARHPLGGGAFELGMAVAFGSSLKLCPQLGGLQNADECAGCTRGGGGNKRK
jgi:hypothetical protein